MSSKLILYDLPSKPPCKSWSPNPWKTRLLLNYKNIPYETQWVEYPDIKPMFEGKVPPNEGPTAYTPYTIPTVKFTDGSYMQESRDIAKRLEHEHPNPSMHLNSESLAKIEELMPKIGGLLRPEFIPKVPKRLLNEASLPHWYSTREKWFGGMSLDRVEQEQGGDTAYMEAAPHIQAVTQLLRAHSDGPFFEGTQVTYADFVWAAYLHFFQRIGDDCFQKLLETTGDRQLHLALLQACGPWFERDDH